MGEKDAEQPVFRAGERDHRALGVDQVAPGGVEPPLGEAQLARIARWRGLEVRGQGARSPQDRADAREQLARHEGLGQVVVGAHLEADDAVHVLAARGQHQDGGVGVCAAGRAQVAAQAEAVLARHHHVEHDEVDLVALERELHFAAVCSGGAAQALLLEIVGEQAADLAIVVDDQDVVLRGGHRVCSMERILRWAVIALYPKVSGGPSETRGFKNRPARQMPLTPTCLNGFVAEHWPATETRIQSEKERHHEELDEDLDRCRRDRHRCPRHHRRDGLGRGLHVRRSARRKGRLGADGARADEGEDGGACRVAHGPSGARPRPYAGAEARL